MKSVDEYKLPTYDSRIVYLKPAQLIQLRAYYHSAEIPDHLKRTLGQFLFSCISGLRFSDIERVTWASVQDDMLIFEPYKTRKLQKVVRIPLYEIHFSLIQNERGKLFTTISGQQTNSQLKTIALAAGVRVILTTHVARHTFATETLRKGGKVQVLQQLMGHKKITTTMIYVHVDDEMLREDMRRLIE
jgi:integrase